MVELGNIALKDDLIGVIDRALDAGVDADTFTDMVAERVKARRVSDADDIVGLLDADEMPPGDAGDVIYDELPPGLIDLPTARDRYGKNISAMREWVKKGHVRKVGLRRAPARGGGYIVVDEGQLVAYMNCPKNKGGRPKKSSKKST